MPTRPLLALLLCMPALGCAKGAPDAQEAAQPAPVDPVTAQPASVCGNGRIDPGEDCDGADLRGETCLNLGFAGDGVLTCDPMTCSFNTGMCNPTPPQSPMMPMGGTGGG